MASRTLKIFSLSIVKALTTVVMLVSSMILARILSKHDLGTVRQTLLVYQFAAPLLMLGIPEAVFYFLPGEKKRQRGVLIDNLTLLVILACLFSLFLTLGGNELMALRFGNPDLAQTLKWMIPYPLFVIPATALRGVMVIKERVNALAVYSVVSTAVTAMAVIGATLWSKGYAGPLMAHIVVPALFLPIALWLMFSSVPGEWTLPDLMSIKKMLQFSVPLGMATMFGTMTQQLDKVIVSALTSPEEFAVYANGAIEIPLIGIITGSVTVVIMADMRKSIVEGNYQEAVRLFRRTAEKTSYILFPAMIFLFISADSFIQTIFTEKYARSVIPFRWYLLLIPMRTVIFGSLLMAMGKTKIILIRSVIEIATNAVLSVIFVSFLGPWGAVVATVITIYTWNIIYLIMLSKFLSTPWYSFFPFRIWGTSLGFLMFPSAVLLTTSAFSLKLPAFIQLTLHGLVFWSIIVFWWNGKIYSIRSIAKRIGFTGF